MFSLSPLYYRFEREEESRKKTKISRYRKEREKVKERKGRSRRRKIKLELVEEKNMRGKRSFLELEDLHIPLSSISKRLRFSTGSSPLGLSLPHPSSSSDSSSSPAITHLMALFPDVDQQVFLHFLLHWVLDFSFLIGLFIKICM